MKTKQKNSTTKSYLAERISSRGGILALVFGITCMIFNDFKVNPDSNPADFNTIAVDYNSIAVDYNLVAVKRNDAAVKRDRSAIRRDLVAVALHFNVKYHKQAPKPRNPVMALHNLIRGSPRPSSINRKPARDSVI